MYCSTTGHSAAWMTMCRSGERCTRARPNCRCAIDHGRRAVLAHVPCARARSAKANRGVNVLFQWAQCFNVEDKCRSITIILEKSATLFNIGALCAPPSFCASSSSVRAVASRARSTKESCLDARAPRHMNPRRLCSGASARRTGRDPPSGAQAFNARRDQV